MKCIPWRCVSISLNPLEAPMACKTILVSVGMWPSATLSRYYAMWSPWNNEFRHRLYTAITWAAFLVFCCTNNYFVCAVKLKRERHFDDSNRINKTTAVTRVECNHFIVYSFCDLIWLFWFFSRKLIRKSNQILFRNFLLCCAVCVPKFVYIPTFIVSFIAFFHQSFIAWSSKKMSRHFSANQVSAEIVNEARHHFSVVFVTMPKCECVSCYFPK